MPRADLDDPETWRVDEDFRSIRQRLLDAFETVRKKMEDEGYG